MIPIFKPYMPNHVMPEIEKILYSGNLTFGNYGKQFEEKLKLFIGNPRIITVSSYNQAMLIAISTLGLQPDDEVIASPVSCLASNQPFAIKNVKVVWADVNPKTGSLDPEDVKQRITSKTKAIFHNHFCGFLGQIDEIHAIAKANNLFVVEDCIEAFGSVYKGKKMGNTAADISVFSFQTVRLPNTIDGGALTFNNDALFEKAKLIRDYGIDRSKFRDSNNEISADCDITLEGYGAVMGEVNSYIGVRQMEDIEELLGKQARKAEDWHPKIGKIDGVTTLPLTSDTTPNYWVYGVLCENKLEALKDFRESGYYATGVHINNNLYSVFNNNENLKGVNEFMNSFLAIPCGWWI